jgi:60 kDa SS-A/Ro ribonucleoprotein
MSLVTLNSERETHVIGFTSGPVTPLRIAKGDRLDNVVSYINQQPMGGTDCSLPMIYAAENRIPTEVFVVYTDSETWAGDIQPVEALKRYRDRMGIPAKLIVVGMMSNGFTLADPNDAGMMDVVGFDTAAPAVMADFARH